jgi:hypothetical protein
VDVAYHYSFNRPADDTISGSSEVFRHGEVQLTQFGWEATLHWKGVRARLMTQFGMYSQTTPRNDSSPSRGQWNLADAFRYVSRPTVATTSTRSTASTSTRHLHVLRGPLQLLPVRQLAYQPSYVSSNTPWFFNGVRIQVFTSDKLKIEPWIVNGWQSYGRFNSTPGLGVQILWRPTGWLSMHANQYFGADTLGSPDRKRVHSDDSVQVKYLDRPAELLSKAAFTVTTRRRLRVGRRRELRRPVLPGLHGLQPLLVLRDRFAVTVGGGAITNPGRYLVLAAADQRRHRLVRDALLQHLPGTDFQAWDGSLTFDWMPIQVLHLPRRVRPPARERLLLRRSGA